MKKFKIRRFKQTKEEKAIDEALVRGDFVRVSRAEFNRIAKSLEARKKDHQYLLEGEVFTKDLIDTWILLKEEKEIPQVMLRPHPWEYHLYYDV